MLAILLRFHTHKYGIVTDIEKAFHHLNLHVEDRDFTRFLWLSDPTDSDSSFITYRFRAVPFGTTSSPFMLNATIQYHLEHFNSPVSLDMKKNMYIDNVISGADTEKSAVNYYQEGRTLMNDAKFNLRSWASNCSALQDVAAQESTAHTGEEINTLGMRWNTSSDTHNYFKHPSTVDHKARSAPAVLKDSLSTRHNSTHNHSCENLSANLLIGMNH